MEIPSKYVLPCKTNGKCRQIALEQSGISVFPSVAYGMNFIEVEPGNFKSRINFRCCIGCKQPVSSEESVWLNDQLGLELPTIESLRDRMAKLRKTRGQK